MALIDTTGIVPTDSSGSPTSGTTFNAAWFLAIYAAVNAAVLKLASPIVTPAQITSDQHNYNPTGLSTANVLRLSTDASRTITGIVAQAGRRLILANAGAQNIVLAHQSGSSSALNRLSNVGAASLTLNVSESAEYFYDDAAGFWVQIGHV